jgi:hypothetical protein
MSQQDLLRSVVRTLDDCGCEHMLTGSFASSLQGEPRLSHDIDLVVDMAPPQIPALLTCFPPPEFHLDRQSILDAMAHRSMFTLLSVLEGDKIDFWLLTDDPFDVARFKRRQREEVLGMSLSVSSPEDTILSKLRWAKLSGGSERQAHDALRVYEVQFGVLDLGYVQRWVKTMGLQEYWARLLEEARPG